MSIDFSTVKAITIPEGIVTKITSAAGVLWAAQTDPVVNVGTMASGIHAAFKLAAASLPDRGMALFAGGTTSALYVGASIVFGYTADGSRISLYALDQARCYLAAATVGGAKFGFEAAIFAGGMNNSTICSTVDAYRGSTKIGIKPLGAARFGLVGITMTDHVSDGTTVSDLPRYAFFIGGASSTSGTVCNYVDIYDVDLTLASITPSNTTCARHSHAGVGFSEDGSLNAVIAGGSSGSSYTSYIASVTPGGTVSLRGTLAQARANLAATKVGDTALFAGGNNASTQFQVVDTITAEGTKSTAMPLSVARANLAAITVGDYAIFAGGSNRAQTAYYDTVDIYDASLTQQTVDGLSVARWGLAAATVGNLALFAGGKTSGLATDIVEVYEVKS